MRELDAGWGWPNNARKAHWFDEGEVISLCGKWMYVGPRDHEQAKHSPDDCANCTEKLARRAGTT